MRPNSRLDKAIRGLQELVQRHNKQDKFRISKGSIIIETNGSQFLGTLLYLFLILLLPAGLLLYYLLTDNSSVLIFLLLLWEILFAFDLWKMIKGDTILTIDLNKSEFRVININGVFKKWFKQKVIAFDELSEVHLKEKSVATKYSRTVWLRLTITNKQNRNIVLTDMSNDYPESYIARKVKFLVDVIIWTQKKAMVPAA